MHSLGRVGDGVHRLNYHEIFTVRLSDELTLNTPRTPPNGRGVSHPPLNDISNANTLEVTYCGCRLLYLID